MEPLFQVFDLVCGRHHCWAPGGEVLPFCQRCTGLYVGAAVTVVLYVVFKPRPTLPSLGIHGMLLLLMVPFGYHLVPQNGAIRTLTGQLFAVGLVCYLSLLPSSRWTSRQDGDKHRSLAYAVCVLGSLAVLQAAVHAGGRLVGELLAWLGLFGFVALALLVAANIVLLPQAIWRALRAEQRGAARHEST